MADPQVEKEIYDILRMEGEGGGAQRSDAGGRTAFGISEKSNPEAWKDGKVTEAEARGIYEQKYLIGTGISKILDPHLQAQMLDWAVNSGPGVAIQNIQTILGTGVDGVLGAVTLGLVNKADPKLLGNALVAARVKMLCRIVTKDPSQLKFLNGWASRALEFLS